MTTTETPLTAHPESHSETSTRIHPSAVVDDLAQVGERTAVWQGAHVREGVRIGSDCIIGAGTYLGPGVVVGDRCKVQNHALVYEPAVLGDGVFVGPAVVMTNDLFPRAVTTDGRLKGAEDWTAVGVTLRDGASVGARAVLVAPLTVGRWAMVAAGAVVTRDVPDFALVAGVPARRVRWVGRAGVPLDEVAPGELRCPRTDERYRERDGRLTLLEEH